MQHKYIMGISHKELRGFEYLVYSTFALLLLVVMLLLPLAPVFANDEITPSTITDSIEQTVAPVVAEENVADTQTTDQEVSPKSTDEPMVGTEKSAIDLKSGNDEVESVNDQIQNEDSESVLLEEVETITDGEVSVTDTEDVADLSLDTNTNEDINDISETLAPDEQTVEDNPLSESDTDIEEILTEDIVSQDEVVNDSSDNQSNSDSSNPQTQNDDMSTTTEVGPVQGTTVVVNSLTNDDNKFSFAANECTTVGDGSFYCTNTSKTPEVLQSNRIFSAPDASGDKEIYIEKNGLLTTLTNNDVDDDAPYYDEISNTAVWHRLIDGRYQIISYDFDTNKETQITNDRFNNMQPSRSRDSTVWQGWVGNDWEIFLLQNDELKMLTDNTMHDIAPSINGSYVVWQSFEGNAWRMKVYDIQTGITNTIEDSNGASIENPRFVLVYDSKSDSGDVETKGYDPKSGKVVHLGAEPVSLPDEIPDPDQTGEKRALVTSTAQIKPKTEGDIDEVPNDDDIATGNDSDLIIAPIDTSSQSTSTEQVDTFISTDLQDESASAVNETRDIIIPQFDDVSTISTEHIADIIVTPYVEQIATTTSE